MKIDLKNITKKFGNLVAVNNVNLSILDGEIHSIVGENGAGKSTLMKILYGVHKPTSGVIEINGKKIFIANSKKALQLGIGMVHQEFMLVDDFTVYENVVLGFEPSSKGVFLRRTSYELVKKLCRQYKIDLDINEKILNLSVGQKQKVEILKLLYRKAKILILDEPTAVLTPEEVETLFETVRQFKRSGKTVIFISHKLKEVIDISDRVTIMRNGSLLATYKNNNLNIDKLSEMIAGRKISKITFSKSTTVDSKEAVLELNDVFAYNNRGETKLKNFSLRVNKGEVYGIAGVSGNGQSELEEIISGISKNYTGEIKLFGKSLKTLSVKEIRNLGMSYIPEDRLKTGLAPIATIRENFLLGYHEDRRFLGNFGLLRSRQIHNFVVESIKKYDIAAFSPKEQVGNLSGGNMQRVVIAREFEHDPDFILISHPTRGVDIGGIEFIHKKLLEMKENFKTVLLISADIDEILSLSDRIGVIYNGKIVYEDYREKIDMKKIGKAMLTGNVS
jgi:simple sugar transport system ATP-binding protein